jgi:phosphohistidine phosphatase
VQAVAALLKRLDIEFDAIISSPYTRAFESAQELCRALDYDGSSFITVDERLHAEAGVEQAIEVICEQLPGTILMVGHEPALSRLASHLLGLEQARLTLKKAGLVELRLVTKEPLRFELFGWLRPGYLRL